MSEQFDKRSIQTLPNDDGHDLVLLDRITMGDREAFHELYTCYYHPLLRFLYRMTNDVDAAQENINDVMFTVWQKSGTFARRSKVSTWIIGIAYNKALKYLQKRTRWVDRFKAAEFDESIEPSPAAGALTDKLDAEDLLERGMRTLSAKHRATVELTYFHGCSYEEIAAVMDCPVNTVKTRMFHAKEKLKQALSALERDGTPPNAKMPGGRRS